MPDGTARRLLCWAGANVKLADTAGTCHCDGRVNGLGRHAASGCRECGALRQRRGPDGHAAIIVREGPRRRRGCCWTKARRSIGRTRTVRRRCGSPALTATSTRRGCCWTTARTLIGRGRRRNAAVRRLPEGPRRRGAAVAGQGAEVDRARSTARRRCIVACQNGHVDGAAAAGERRRSTGRGGGQTPLIVACEKGTSSARLLLDKGAGVGRRGRRDAAVRPARGPRRWAFDDGARWTATSTVRRRVAA